MALPMSTIRIAGVAVVPVGWLAHAFALKATLIAVNALLPERDTFGNKAGDNRQQTQSQTIHIILLQKTSAMNFRDLVFERLTMTDAASVAVMSEDYSFQ